MSKAEVALTRDDPSRPCGPILPAWDDSIINHYYHGLAPSVRAYLAVFGAMSLGGRTKPLSLIFETPSGYGKTAVLQMAFAEQGSRMAKYVYRSDCFTPKSFVSHAANVSAAELESIDMLPKLKDRVLITKELAPIFRGRQDELTSNFSMLISVLDGKGFVSNSGSRGERGYHGSIVFNWVGATTPIPAETHQLMAQLGTRFLFYEVPAHLPTEADLLVFLDSEHSAHEAEKKCNEAVQNFVCQFFERHPLGTIDKGAIEFPDAYKIQLVRLAKLLTQGRAKLRYEKVGAEYEAVSADPPEAPYRALQSLKELAFGHALISGRFEITLDDLGLVRDVALSSVPGHLRPIIKALTSSESVDTATCRSLCGVSSPTARKRFRELELLGLADPIPAPASNESNQIALADQYSWLREGTENETEVCVVN
jgi:hypothetical protein